MSALYGEGVVEGDTLQFIETEEPGGDLKLVRLDGLTFTTDGGVLETRKQLSVAYRRGVPYVATSEYVYMALWRSRRRTTQPLFRYDNCHGELETLHKHLFDDAGDPAGIKPLAPDLMPYMDDVIRETAWLARHLAARA